MTKTIARWCRSMTRLPYPRYPLAEMLGHRRN